MQAQHPMQAQLHDQPAAAPGGSPAYATRPDYLPPSTSPTLPYAPLPKRRGAGPTVLLTIAALVIPAIIFGIPALVSGGDGTTASEGHDSRPGERPEPDGPTLEGAGYVYAVPDGWKDATSWAHDVAPDSADSAVSVTRPDNGFDTNVLVAAWDADGADTVDAAWDAWRPSRGVVTRLEPMTIDGVRALGIRNEVRNQAGRKIVQVGYLALWHERLYSIVLSAPIASEGERKRAFDAVLDTWTWTEGEQPAASVA